MNRQCSRMWRGIMLAVFAAFAALSLQAAGSRSVTLNLRHATLKEVLASIERQTDYRFSYKSIDIAPYHDVTVRCNATPVEQALDMALRNTRLGYEIMSEKSIIITAKAVAEPTATSGRKTVKGKVSDTSGDPVTGATVRQKGTANATVTDIDGEFAITAPEGAEIEISFIGCSPQSFFVDDTSSPVNVTMHENSSMLNEVVVIGYGTQKKVNLTGAVAVVDGEQLQSRSANNMTQLLQGAVPNMNIRMPNGRPGESGSINIRGVQTISGSASGMQPLVLIDGVEGDINTVNPNDVESISVLKDASSAAVYGARAAFGVILVTTKIGKEGRSHVSYSGSYSFSRPTVCTDFETRGYYSAAINDYFWSAYQGSNYTTYNEEDYYELWIRRNDKTEHPDRPWVMVKDGQYKYYANTDWYNYLYDESRPTWDHNISINGGTEKVRYFLSGNYHKQDGIIRVQKDYFEKYNFRSKVDASITDFLKISNNTSFYYQTYEYGGSSGVAGNLGAAVDACLASDVPRNPDGTAIIYPSSHPTYSSANGKIAIYENGKNINRDKSQTFQTTFEARLTPIKQVEIVGNYTYLYNNIRYMNRSANVTYSNVPGVVGVWDTGSAANKLWQKNTDSNYHSYNIYGTYGDTFADSHNVKVTAGINYESRRWEHLSAERDGLLSDDLNDMNLAAGENITVSGGKDQYKLFGMFYRVNYDFKGRYLFEAGGRYDGSSRFSHDHRYGFFPSFSAGWRISEEPFFATPRQWVNNLKLRLSYGKLGNQQSVGYYDYIQTISTAGQLNYLIDGDKADKATVSSPNASDLTWETVTSKNIGLEIGLFNGRLNIEGDIYQRDTKDILTNGRDLPSVYGAAIPKMNAADIRTKGWELTISWNDQFQLAGRPLRYSATAGLADNTSKVRHFNNPQKVLGTPYDGQQLGEIWGFITDGYFLSDEEAFNHQTDQTYMNSLINTMARDPGLHAGDLKFVDLDGNGVMEPALTADNPRDQKVIGNSLPRYTYSFRISADYAGFDFSALIQGVGRQHWYPGHDANLYWGPYSRPSVSFLPVDFLDNVWTPENPNAKFPRPRGYVAFAGNGGARELTVINDKYLENVAYCRLKNVVVGYTLPRKWLNAIRMEKIRFYFSGDNLLTFTPFSCKYIDPEMAGAQNTWNDNNKSIRNTYPTNKQFTFGIELTL